MKKILFTLILIIISFYSCKNNDSKVSVNTKESYINQSNNSYLHSCEDIIRNVIKSSDLFLNDDIEYFTRIESIKQDNIVIQVYSKNDLSDNPDIKQVVHNTIAWLLFLPNEKRLLNTTLDPDNPVVVNYNYNNLDELYDFCNIERKDILETNGFEDKIVDDTKIKIDEYSKYLFNRKLVGLSVVDEQSKNQFQKYGLDFSTVCYCDAPSLYIDKKLMEIVIFNYCDNGKIPNNLEHLYRYKIIKTESNLGEIKFTTKPPLKFIFNKIKDIPLYELEIEGEFPKEYIGSDLKKVFTPKPDKFESYDCGDFDG